MQTITTTISRRSRNLAFGWSNRPIRDERGNLIIETPSAPSTVGGIPTVQAQADDRHKISGGADSKGALFVGGKRVVSVVSGGEWVADGGDINTILYLLTDTESNGVLTVEVEA